MAILNTILVEQPSIFDLYFLLINFEKQHIVSQIVVFPLNNPDLGFKITIPSGVFFTEMSIIY